MTCQPDVGWDHDMRIDLGSRNAHRGAHWSVVRCERLQRIGPSRIRRKGFSSLRREALSLVRRVRLGIRARSQRLESQKVVQAVVVAFRLIRTVHCYGQLGRLTGKR